MYISVESNPTFNISNIISRYLKDHIS